jgi:hypothetical protein
MKTKPLGILALTLTMILVLAAVSSADVPPPPVNQNLGIPDTTFNNLAEPECRACHNTNPPPGIPVDPTYLPTRHHLLVNTPIVCPTAAPNVTCPTTDDYECLSCHTLEWNGSSWALTEFNDCTVCHIQSATATVHHLTPQAVAWDCKACHGSLIDNPGDGHTIPWDRDVSFITPQTGIGTGIGGEGGCAFCHEAGTDTDSEILVYTNAETHHSTGVTLPPFDTDPTGNCFKCHDTHPGSDLGTLNNDIRACQQCHGVGSLHNIQTDSDGNGIEGGEELAYYGHIGNNADCNGCHLNNSDSPISALSLLAAPDSGPIIPSVNGLSAYSFTAGADSTITVFGSAFTNTVQGPTGPIVLTSNVVLTAANGSTVSLTPGAISESSMDVTLPATLAAGNYELRAVKGTKASGPVVVAVIPAVTIDSATCKDGIVTISGSGFSQYLNAADSGTGVQIVDGGTCTIISWTDTEIVADSGTCVSGSEVAVDSVYGAASADVTVKKLLLRRPPRR